MIDLRAYKDVGIAILVALMVCLMVSTGWWIRGRVAAADEATLKEEHARYVAEVERSRSASLQETANVNRALVQATDKANAQYKELQDARKQNADLVRKYGDGIIRVRVPATCTAASMPASDAASGAGLGDGAGTAELDPAFAESVAGITADGDDAIRKLTVLQQYLLDLQKILNSKKPAEADHGSEPK